MNSNVSRKPAAFAPRRVVAALLGALAAPLCLPFGAALAVPAAGTPYFTDPTSTYVEDATSAGIGTVNMITCMMKAIDPADLVNLGAYKALVDENKCDSSKRSSTGNAGAAAGAAAPTYSRVTANSTRQSSADPMVAKIWLHEDDMGGGPGLIHVGLSATAAPSTGSPYGVFRLDFCGVATGTSTCLMRGALIASTGGLSFYQNEANGGGGGGPKETKLALNRDASTDGGSGRLAFEQNGVAGAFYFAYNATHYLRGDGTTNLCFSRTLADADASVWRYGVYTEAGAQVDLNAGFPVIWTEAASGKTYQGNIGYYGLWMQDDKTVADGDTLERQSFGQNAAPVSYRIAKAAGRLTKYARHTATLDTLVNMKFTAGITTTSATAHLALGFNNIEMSWNGTQFVKSGDQTCDGSGCRIVPTNPVAPIANSEWSSAQGGVFGYAQTLNGELRIADSELAKVVASAAPGTIQVGFREQSLVYPGDMPTTLYCLGECADKASMTAYFGPSHTANSPWIAGTDTRQYQPGGFAPGELKTYRADRNTGLLSQSGVPLTWDTAWVLGGSSPYQGGLRNGKLFTDPAAVACELDATKVCGNKIDDLDTYYVWETGPNSYNQFVALTTLDGSNCGTAADKYCRFDAPVQLTYQVPNETAAYGTYAGQTIALQYGGFGNLWGIPGHCVDHSTNQTVDCPMARDDNIRYVPAFVIPFDAVQGTVTGTLAGVQGTYYVKWLDREVRFKKLATAACGTLTLPNGLALPDGTDFKNPGLAASADYIGVEPTVTGTPRVIDGDLKY